ncbi:arylamine N-acetyltransferase family protein [Marinobacterium jannaschii]|uniref:arylamine N-acetyltransferase family protein n=1 Tax=Marinobacterium jannaschii TaxID=64970 RepID=UPI00047F34AB|nr:arylamine N-acetyltransferase [Marinobacterium jannaschii]
MTTLSHNYLRALEIDPADYHLGENELATDGLELLRLIHQRHVTRYSFNNLAVALQQEMPLDTEALYNKIVVQQRGGYCFEHNKLAFEVMTELGFNPRILMGRVIYNRDVEVPRTHRISLLTLGDEEYIVDVGFGHFGPRFPLKLELGLVQDQGDNCYRIEQNQRGEYCFQILKEGEFFTLYTFDRARYNEADCETGHFYSHKHPQAGFVNNLVVCRKFDDHTLSLRNGEIHHLSRGETRIETIDSAPALQDKLASRLAVDLDLAVAEYLFDRFVRSL